MAFNNLRDQARKTANPSGSKSWVAKRREQAAYKELQARTIQPSGYGLPPGIPSLAESVALERKQALERATTEDQ